MLPEFDEHGYLPPGVHVAALDEIRERFGRQTQERREQFESIEWLVETAIRAGVERIILNGSWTTDSLRPNDVDCLLIPGVNFPIDATAERELLEGIPYLAIEFVDELELANVLEFFLTDRRQTEKGVVELRL